MAKRDDKNTSRLKKQQLALWSQVRNSMGTKLGQSSQPSEVRNKAELVQWDVRPQTSRPTNLPMSTVHAWMAQLRSSLSEALPIYCDTTYMYLGLSALKQSCVNEHKNNRDIIENCVWRYIVDGKKKLISPKLSVIYSWKVALPLQECNFSPTV